MHNILILTTWEKDDALIGRYVLPYIPLIKENLEPGSQIYLVTQEKSRTHSSDNIGHPDLNWVPFKYSRFGIIACFRFLNQLIRLLYLIRKENINEIHPWCTPAGVMGILLSQITGKLLIVDSFEPHAEPMAESFTWNRDSFAFKILFRFEKIINKRANYVIAANKDMSDYCLKKYGSIPVNFSFKPACVNLHDFNLSKRKNAFLLRKYGLEKMVVLVYAGKFGGSYLEHEIFELAKAASKFFGDNFRFLILNGQKEEYVRSLCDLAGFDFSLVIKTFVPYDQVPLMMGLGDIGIVPFKPVPSKRYGSPIKTAEYLALGIPVIISDNISSDSDIVDDEKVGAVLKEWTTSDYIIALERINVILTTKAHIPERQRIYHVARKYYNFEIAQSTYRTLYEKIGIS